MVKVDKLNWLSQEAKEAEVFLSDGDFRMICFSHPFKKGIGSVISQPIYALNAKEILKLNGEERFSVEKEEGVFNYKMAGRVIDKSKNQIKVGEFILELDNPIPNDIQDGNYVSFSCDRIDIY